MNNSTCVIQMLNFSIFLLLYFQKRHAVLTKQLNYTKIKKKESFYGAVLGILVYCT